jgi:hypothetical protein
MQQRRLIEQALKIVEMVECRDPREDIPLVREVYGDGVRRRVVELPGDAGEEEIMEKRRRSSVATECGGEEEIVRRSAAAAARRVCW